MQQYLQLWITETEAREQNSEGFHNQDEWGEFFCFCFNNEDLMQGTHLKNIVFYA